MKALVLIFSLCISVSTLFATEPLKILFIGNSFTHMNAMPKQFDKLAKSLDQKVLVEMEAKSNHTLKMHCARPELFKTINSKKWDYVIIQPFSRELIFDKDSINEATIPYFQQIMDSIRANNACTNILLYETWGYKNGYAERNDTDSFDEMAMKIENGARYIADTFDLAIVPVGMVWREIVNKHPEINLFDADEHHPSPIGSYLVASTFYAAIYKRSFEGAPLTAYPAEQMKTIHEVTYKYVLSHIDNCDLRKNTFFITKTESNPTTKKYKVSCKSYFKEADSLVWDFGDKTSSKYKFTSHSYKQSGTYTIKLTVNDECGVRVYEQDVYFPAPPVKKKPTPKKKP